MQGGEEAFGLLRRVRPCLLGQNTFLSICFYFVCMFVCAPLACSARGDQERA